VCSSDLRNPRSGARAFLGSAIAVVLAGSVALLTRQAWLFPSLGPMIMLRVEKPDAPESVAAAAVVLVTAVDLLFNRITGGAMPWWSMGPDRECPVFASGGEVRGGADG